MLLKIALLFVNFGVKKWATIKKMVNLNMEQDL